MSDILDTFKYNKYNTDCQGLMPRQSRPHIEIRYNNLVLEKLKKVNIKQQYMNNNEAFGLKT